MCKIFFPKFKHILIKSIQNKVFFFFLYELSNYIMLNLKALWIHICYYFRCPGGGGNVYGRRTGDYSQSNLNILLRRKLMCMCHVPLTTPSSPRPPVWRSLQRRSTSTSVAMTVIHKDLVAWHHPPVLFHRPPHNGGRSSSPLSRLQSGNTSASALRNILVTARPSQIQPYHFSDASSHRVLLHKNSTHTSTGTTYAQDSKDLKSRGPVISSESTGFRHKSAHLRLNTSPAMWLWLLPLSGRSSVGPRHRVISSSSTCSDASSVATSQVPTPTYQLPLPLPTSNHHYLPPTITTFPQPPPPSPNTIRLPHKSPDNPPQ